MAVPHRTAHAPSPPSLPPTPNSHFYIPTFTPPPSPTRTPPPPPPPLPPRPPRSTPLYSVRIAMAARELIRYLAKGCHQHSGYHFPKFPRFSKRQDHLFMGGGGKQNEGGGGRRRGRTLAQSAHGSRRTKAMTGKTRQHANTKTYDWSDHKPTSTGDAATPRWRDESKAAHSPKEM